MSNVEHEYHIDVYNGESGRVETYAVRVSDEHHHTKFDEVVDFISFLSSVHGISRTLIRGFKHIRMLR